MTPRHLRTLRGAAAAWVATVVAATSHTLAGGGAPAPALVGVIGILAWPVGIALVGRRLSPGRVGSAVVAAQLLFHTAFAATAGVASEAGPAGVSGHAHHTALVAAGTGPAAFAVDAPMAIGHLLAAAVTVAGLYYGERMLRALGRGIRSLFARRVVHVLPTIPAVRALEPVLLPTLPSGVVLSDLSRRGPPAFVDAVA